MQKGVSIFYEYHEQGSSHIIAGIYSPTMKTEEEMRTELLSLIGQTEFGERDQPIFVNHTHVYAKFLLDEAMDDDLAYQLRRFFPEAMEPDELPTSARKFLHYDVGTYEFIWNNHYSKELRKHRQSLMEEAAAKYRAGRAERRKEVK